MFDQYGSVGDNIETDTPAVNLTSHGFTIHDRLWVKVFANASGYRTSEGAESPMHGGREPWTVTQDADSTGLHMQIHSNGYLYWDAVPEETSGYSIAICNTIGYDCKWFSASTTSYNIIQEFDNMKKDSNYYRIEVHTKGTNETGTYDHTYKN